MNIKGIKANMRAWSLLAGAGFSFCWIYMVSPIIIGHTPISIKEGTGRCVITESVSGSGAERSLIQPINGAWRISIAMFYTLFNENNSGIWIKIGKQPEAGLIFSFL